VIFLYPFSDQVRIFRQKCALDHWKVCDWVQVDSSVNFLSLMNSLNYSLRFGDFWSDFDKVQKLKSLQTQRFAGF
jgi:hypothetical protein